MPKKIFIGFSIDMDGPNNINKFRAGCNNIIDFFKEINALNSCTWLINHNKQYDTLAWHTDLIKYIYQNVKKYNGCIGLHTHFNSSCFNPPKESLCPEIVGVTRGGWTKMQEDKKYWYESGLEKPKRDIEEFIKNNFNENYSIECFKAGNHMRNKVMFESLMKLGFKYDCTYGYEIKREYTNPTTNIKYTVYDDTNTLISDGPFIIENNNETILEIPECDGLSKIRNMNSNKDFYYIYQLHPDEVAQPWDKNNINDKRNIIINNINYFKNKFKNHNIKFTNMREMGQLIISKKDYHIKQLSNLC